MIRSTLCFENGSMRRILLILGLVFMCASTASARRPRLGPLYKTVSGRIVAYSYSMLNQCLNGNKYLSMIVHIQPTRSIPAQFVQVDFSLPCDKSPDWLSTAQSMQKFRLSPVPDSDEVLEEFMKFTDGGSTRSTDVPLWKRPPGTETETLPFGSIVTHYQSADLSLAPIV
jgi:hypothetical protein